MKIVPWKLPPRNLRKNSTVNQQKLRTKRIISSISPKRVASRVSARSQNHVTKRRRGKTFLERGGIFSDENGRTVVPWIFSVHNARGSATCHARCLEEGASTRWKLTEIPYKSSCHRNDRIISLFLCIHAAYSTVNTRIDWTGKKKEKGNVKKMKAEGGGWEDWVEFFPKREFSGKMSSFKGRWKIAYNPGWRLERGTLG